MKRLRVGDAAGGARVLAARVAGTRATGIHFEPTSQTCSTCGVKDGRKPLDVREWTCAACGTVHDRDVNAARNVNRPPDRRHRPAERR